MFQKWKTQFIKKQVFRLKNLVFLDKLSLSVEKPSFSKPSFSIKNLIWLAINRGNLLMNNGPKWTITSDREILQEKMDQAIRGGDLPWKNVSTYRRENWCKQTNKKTKIPRLWQITTGGKLVKKWIKLPGQITRG